jgi:hypothetical protein
LEVSSRARPTALALRARIRGLAGSRALPRLALAATLAASLLIVLAQPLRSPWWTYADADAPYTASGLNLLIGVPVRYLDHPGLPLEEAIAVTFGVDELVARVSGDAADGQEYVDSRLLDLDRTRPYFRSFAIAFYLLGAWLSFVLIGRVLGHWTWGLAGGLLWVVAPGLVPMSIQFRPDVLLAALLVAVAGLLGLALQRRSAPLYGGAAVLLGLAVMVKMHAAGMLPALALAAVWRSPAEGWTRRLAADVSAFARRRRAALAVGGAVWLGLAAVLNYRRLPFDVTREMALAFVGPPALVTAYLAVAIVAARRRAGAGLRRVFDPFLAFVAGAVVVGLFLPLTLNVPDGMHALVNIANGLSGRHVNETIDPFSTPLYLRQAPFRELLMFALAGIAALVGLRRRDPQPVVWFVGALVLGVMAQARLAAIHYFAPAFVLCVPGALWLLCRERHRPASLLLWPVIAVLVLPVFEHRHDPRTETEQFAESVAPSARAIEARLQPDEVGLTQTYWPIADARYFDLVEPYVNYTPPYPYRFMTDATRALDLARERSLHFRYYTGTAAETVHGTQELEVGSLGTYTVRPVTGVPSVVELLAGPGTAADG